MSNRCIVVGDVHGHYDALMMLIDEIAPTTGDRIYFLGDLIDRGPKSAQVIKFVRESSYPCLLGNHEQMLLEALGNEEIDESALQHWLYAGGTSTIESYGDDGVPPEDIKWMASLPTYLDLGSVWLVHAGVHPGMPLQNQTSEQFCWIRDEFHSMPHPYFPNKLIITGHTITFTLPGVAPGQIAQGNGWLDIDTGAYHPKSGWLTGLDITSGLVYQAHVQKRKIRQRGLAEAVTPVKPSQMARKQSTARF